MVYFCYLYVEEDYDVDILGIDDEVEQDNTIVNQRHGGYVIVEKTF